MLRRIAVATALAAAAGVVRRHRAVRAVAPALQTPALYVPLAISNAPVRDLDLFHDEDVDYARRLERAGVEVDLHVEPGMYHAAERDHAARVPVMAAFRDAALEPLRRRIG